MKAKKVFKSQPMRFSDKKVKISFDIKKVQLQNIRSMKMRDSIFVEDKI